MKTTGNTVLVTGGGSGIGLAIAKRFSELGNQVIITGRNMEKLNNAARDLPNTYPLKCDVTSQADVEALAGKIRAEFPTLTLLVNNAGTAHLQKLAAGRSVYEAAVSEITTNYLATIRLNDLLLETLRNNKEAAIVNVSSVLAFVPADALPTYSASKSALHAYTLALRRSLAEEGRVKVFELMPPLVDTELTQHISSANKMPAGSVAEALVEALEQDSFEIHPGSTGALYTLFQNNPAGALQFINS